MAQWDVYVSLHDHVGNMVFAGESASCSECGQRWEIRPRGWMAFGYHGDYPSAKIGTRGAR